MKKVFIAATRQNDGKTMVSMGLFHAFQKRFERVAYMKPVGQQYKIVDGNKIDKDAVLFSTVYNIPDAAPDMSPIAVPPGFTENYIQNGNVDDLIAKLKASYESLVRDKDFLLLEGTGHAGVGSVFDLCNADVAKLLGAKVVLVSLGGLGRAIDEIMLNKAVFELKGAELLGVVINKVKPDKYDKISPLIRKGLERQGVRVFGCIPFVEMLTRPTVGSIFEELEGDIISEPQEMQNKVEHCVIGDMVPHDALNCLSENTLLIVPANREGLIMSVLCSSLLDASDQPMLSGIVFTGGRRPHQKVLNMIRRVNIPVILVKEDSFSVATDINHMLVKVRAEESEKIHTMQTLIEKYVDVDGICASL